MTFPRIRNHREDNIFTQREMAEILGVQRSAYSLWELGINTIPLFYLNAYCNYFNFSMDYILGISDVKQYTFVNQEIDRWLLGKRLREIRKKECYTQVMVADFLNTTHSTWSAYESGKVLIPTLFIYEFAKKFHCSIDWLCGKVK